MVTVYSYCDKGGNGGGGDARYCRRRCHPKAVKCDLIFYH